MGDVATWSWEQVAWPEGRGAEWVLSDGEIFYLITPADGGEFALFSSSDGTSWRMMLDGSPFDPWVTSELDWRQALAGITYRLPDRQGIAYSPDGESWSLGPLPEQMGEFDPWSWTPTVPAVGADSVLLVTGDAEGTPQLWRAVPAG